MVVNKFLPTLPTIIEGRVFEIPPIIITAPLPDKNSDENRETAVFAAIYARDLKKLQDLMMNKEGCEELLHTMDYAGNTPLLIAGKLGWTKGMGFLILQGADTGHRNFDGKSLSDLSPTAKINWDT